MGTRGPQYRAFMDFSGGQNDTQSEVRLQPNEATSIRNFDLERDGALTKRGGAKKLNGASPLSGEVGMIQQFRPSGGINPINLIANGDKIQTWDDLAAGYTTLVSGLKSNSIVLPAVFRNLCYLVNNYDPPMVYYPGATASPRLFRAGMPTPDALSFTSSGPTTGALGLGKYRFRVRYYSKIDNTFVGEPYPNDQDGLLFDNTSGVKDTSGTLTIPIYGGTGTPTDFNVAGRIIERTTIDGGTFYFEKYIDNNTETSTEIGTMTDEELIEQEIAPDLDTRLPMPKMWPIISYGNRIVGADPDDLGRIVWSEIDEFGILPEAYPDTYYQYLDVEDAGDAPQAVAKLGEYLVWYCGRSIHLMGVDSGGTGFTRRISGHRIGFPNPRCVVELPNGHLIWSLKGPYFFNGTELVFIGERIESFIKSINKIRLGNMYAVHRTQERRRQVRFIFPESGVRNNVAATYHYRRVTLNPEGFPVAHAWTFADGFEAKSGAMILDPSSNEEVEYSGDYAGFLYREDSGGDNQHIAGGEIAAEWQGPWHDMGSPHEVKDFEELWLFVVGKSESPQNLTLRIETEFTKGHDESVVMDIADPDSPIFGTAIFGTAVFNKPNLQILHTHTAVDGVVPQGKYVRYTFTNDSKNEEATIAGYIVKFSIDRDRNDPPI